MPAVPHKGHIILYDYECDAETIIVLEGCYL